MTTLIKIGNSHGIRIPKSFIEKAKLRDCEIELELRKDGLLIKPLKKARNGWDSAKLQKLAKSENLEGLSQDFKSEDLREWEF